MATMTCRNFVRSFWERGRPDEVCPAETVPGIVYKESFRGEHRVVSGPCGRRGRKAVRIGARAVPSPIEGREGFYET